MASESSALHGITLIRRETCIPRPIHAEVDNLFNTTTLLDTMHQVDKEFMHKSLALFILASLPVMANDYQAELTQYVQTELKQISADPLIIEAIKLQNAKNANLTQSEIDQLDKQWRAEVGQSDTPMIQSVLNTPASQKLMEIQNASNGKITEVFVMDNKGLNVAQSEVTSDYWQGDEAKWQNTYSKGVGAFDISDIEEDESTQVFQAQVSYTVVDPSSGEAIGAITVGINVDAL